MPFLYTSDLRKGRNGTDAPSSLAENECQDAVNVDWYRAKFARRRGGSTATAFTSSPFTGTVKALFRHVPDTLDSAAELWGTDSDGVVGRLAGGTVWAAPSLIDTPIVGTFRSAVSLSGKFFLAYNSLHDDRLHVWDGSTVRRAGLAAPSAGPTLANVGGAGTYPAIPLYFRVRFIEQVGGITVRRSEPSVATAFTPSGVNGQIQVTRPAAVGEGETQWESEISLDNANFYVVHGEFGYGGGANPPIVIGTAAANISILPSALVSPMSGGGALSPMIGTYTVPPAAKYLASDQNRLLMFGDYITTKLQNRIYVGAVVGSLNVGDAERMDTTTGYYIDLDERDSGQARGLLGPMNGTFMAFKDRQTWVLDKTGNPATPYSQRCLSKVIGAIDATAHCIAEDEGGSPAAYWMSRRGPYRYGKDGMTYIGHGIEDLILGPTSTMSTGTQGGLCHAIYYEAKRQVWFWFCTGGATVPNTLVVYTIGQNGAPSGWSRFTGAITAATASVLFSSTVGATMSSALIPYIAQSAAVNRIWTCDTGTQDGDATNFQSYVRLRTLAPWGPERNGTMKRAYLLAAPQAATTIRQSLTQDFGAQAARTSDVSIAAVGSETQVRRKFEDCAAQGIGFFDLQVGDSAAANIASWRLDAHFFEWAPEDIA